LSGDEQQGIYQYKLLNMAGIVAKTVISNMRVLEKQNYDK